MSDLEDIVLVGGQALNFWADYYAERIPRLDAPLTRADLDFVGPPAARASARLGSVARVPAAFRKDRYPRMREALERRCARGPGLDR